MDGFCDMVKRMINPVVHGHVFFSALQFSARWKGLKSLTDEKAVVNNGKEVEIEAWMEKVLRWNECRYSISKLLDNIT